jgi:hypothetical protein
MGISTDWRAELYGVRCWLAPRQVDLDGVPEGVNARAFKTEGFVARETNGVCCCDVEVFAARLREI